MNGPKKAPPVFGGIRSTTVQALLTSHKDYAKWKQRAEEHNKTYPAFRFNFEKKWADAKEVKDIIAGLSAQKAAAERAIAASQAAPMSQASSSALVQVPPKVPDQTPVVTAAPKKVAVDDTQTSKEQALLSTMFTGAALPATAYQVPVVVDPYAGLSTSVRNWATGINTWNQGSGMAGASGATMTQQQQEELTAWVLARRTGGGRQKFAVIIGQGSGAYSAFVQFKVIGYAQRSDGTAMTYHISLSHHSYRPAHLPAHFGF